MSIEKITNEELHAEVFDYCHNWIGESQEAFYLHEMIDTPNIRDDRYEQFMEYLNIPY